MQTKKNKYMHNIIIVKKEWIVWFGPMYCKEQSEDDRTSESFSLPSTDNVWSQKISIPPPNLVFLFDPPTRLELPVFLHTLP